MMFSKPLRTRAIGRELICASLVLAFLSACAASGTAPIRSVSQSARAAVSDTVQRTGGGIRVTVQKGDSVYGLSRRYGASARAIIDANSMRPPYVLQPGQQLFMPQATMHLVAKGDTLYSISRSFDVDMTSLAKLNGLRPPYGLSINQLLKVPSIQFAPRQVASDVGKSATKRLTKEAKNTVRDAVNPSKQRVELPKPGPKSGKNFAWPLRGNVVMGFGPRPDGYHNDGINIAVASGTAVHAAENGVVGYAGNELMGYGELLVVRHAEGWITAYAHNSELLVKRGDRVTRGQIVARSGNTGNVTEPQLHFEVRKGKKAINPIEFLVADNGAKGPTRFAGLQSQ